MSDNNLKFIIIAEIPKLCVPNGTAIRVQTLKESFYLYSDAFINSLKNINSEISKLLNISTYQSTKYFFSLPQIEKRPDLKTYIVSEINIDLIKEPDQIYSEVREFFKPLIILFEFFLREKFAISTIYVFKKLSCGYRFIRMLKQHNSYKDLSNKSKLKEIIYIEDIEHRFSKILTRFWGKESYTEDIEEYLTGKLLSFYVTDKISHFWNSLEHLAHRYCKERDLDRLLNDKKLGIINGVILGVLKLLEEKDIVFPNLKKAHILSGNLIKLKNKPPITNKIFYLCDKIHFNLTNDEKNLIRVIYFIRNKLFHETQYILHYARQIAKRLNIPNFNYRNLGEIEIKFSLLVERIFMKFFRIIPNYFELKRKELYHKLTNKSYIIPYLRNKRNKKRVERKTFLNRAGLTPKQAQLKRLKYDKKRLLANEKFLNVMKFLERFKSRFKNFTQKRYISGLLKGDNQMLEIELKFKDDLEGDINFLFGTWIQIQLLIRDKLKFRSLYNKPFNYYGIEFEIFITGASNELKAPWKIQSTPTGNFQTLLIDFRRFVPDDEPHFLDYSDLYSLQYFD